MGGNFSLYKCVLIMSIGTNFKVRGLKLCSKYLKQGVWGRSPPEAIEYFHFNTDTFFI